ncbi:MAG: hypothetical protein J6K39_03950 [Clostridia bacterium]|nr:hypothetical protein [Clostridia bacterium]
MKNQKIKEYGIEKFPKSVYEKSRLVSKSAMIKNVECAEDPSKKRGFENFAEFDTSFVDRVETGKSSMVSEYLAGDRSVCDIVLANLVVLFSIFLACFLPVVNLALPILLCIYFEVGVFAYIHKKECGQKYRFEDLFVSVKKIVKIFCVYVVKMISILFWTCLLIVPGVICALNYAFAPLILHESSDLDAKGVLILSKEIVKGHRWNIFFFVLLSMASICIAMSTMYFIIVLFDMFLEVTAIYYIVFVLLAGVFDLVLLAIPMVQLAIVDSYIAAKKEKTSKFC